MAPYGEAELAQAEADRREDILLDCVRAGDPILNVQEHPPLRGAGRITDSSLPGHDLRHLRAVSGEKCGLVDFLE